ncbi:MAG: OmpA family protein, partial [Paludibacteraceae bacterium]|nr:OmpA family protein [Paludibacteraceae bacterium]
MDFINKNPDKKFLISGFTDERGTEEYNLELSKRRAKRVYNVLCKRGVNPKRLMFVGLGTQGLVIKNAKNESEHQKNRRVEIRLVD